MPNNGAQCFQELPLTGMLEGGEVARLEVIDKFLAARADEVHVAASSRLGIRSSSAFRCVG